MGCDGWMDVVGFWDVFGFLLVCGLLFPIFDGGFCHGTVLLAE
jgi:hypothetical protein